MNMLYSYPDSPHFKSLMGQLQEEIKKVNWLFNFAFFPFQKCIEVNPFFQRFKTAVDIAKERNLDDIVVTLSSHIPSKPMASKVYAAPSAIEVAAYLPIHDDPDQEAAPKDCLLHLK